MSEVFAFIARLHEVDDGWRLTSTCALQEIVKALGYRVRIEVIEHSAGEASMMAGYTEVVIMVRPVVVLPHSRLFENGYAVGVNESDLVHRTHERRLRSVLEVAATELIGDGVP